MKVKCKNIYNEHTKQFEESSSSLTIGNEYVVLEAIASANRALLYRLVGDNENKMPALYSASQFEITSDLISSIWGTTIINKSLMVMGPKDWRKDEFWDACYDHDPKALEIYKREAMIIYQEEGML